jgi:maleate isomerase
MLELVRRPRLGIGTITPSGNVVVERVTTAILTGFPEVSGHYSRVEVTGSSDKYPHDYDWDGMLGAAELLSHARPAAIVWNGSRGGSFGFDVDRTLCARITERSGIPSTTATLAVDAAFRAGGVRRIGLVTPYRPAYIAKIPPVFAKAGYEIVTEAHAGLEDNLSYALLPDADIVGMIRTVAAHDIDAVLTFCTNLPAAHLVDAMERELDIPVFDSTSAAVWAALRLAGQPTAPGRAWGSLFGRDLDL